MSLNPPAAVEAAGITKRFGALAALDGVSVRFAPGSFHALLGENGAGKSTLAKCIMGYYRADAGELFIGGRKCTVTNPRQAHRLGLGMVYQHFTLVPNMTVMENLVLGGERLPAVIDWRAERTRLEEFLATMPFRLGLDRRVAWLAAGEKQKLEILKQLLLGHRFLILDEPTSVLTPSEAAEILGLMRRMAEEGELTVVLITHKLREVEEFAREVTVLRGGRVAGHGPAGELSRADLVRMMIGREEVAPPAARAGGMRTGAVLELRSLTASSDKGGMAVRSVNLEVGAGQHVRRPPPGGWAGGRRPPRGRGGGPSPGARGPRPRAPRPPGPRAGRSVRGRSSYAPDPRAKARPPGRVRRPGRPAGP